MSVGTTWKYVLSFQSFNANLKRVVCETLAKLIAYYLFVFLCWVHVVRRTQMSRFGIQAGAYSVSRYFSSCYKYQGHQPEAFVCA